MKIKSITPIGIALPLNNPIKMAGVELTTADNIVVRVETDDGTVGWGEAPSAPLMTGETVESMAAAVTYLAPFLVGREATDLRGNLEVMEGWMYGNQSAKSAIDVALHDIVGKVEGKPVYELLAEKKRDRLPVLWMLAAGEMAADQDEAKRKLDEGFQAFKIKVGVNRVGTDVERAEHARHVVGSDIVLSADANQAWSTDDAIAFVSGAKRAHLDFIEQPTRGSDLDGMAAIAAAASAPLGVDEGIHSIADIRRHHDRGAASGGSLKLIKFGGLTRAHEAARLCDELGMKVNWAGKVAESSIATAALLHIAAVSPNMDWGLSISSQYLAADIVKNPIVVSDGHTAPPAGPGLGVDVDEDALERYRRPV